jgi:hypothetical protein
MHKIYGNKYLFQLRYRSTGWYTVKTESCNGFAADPAYSIELIVYVIAVVPQVAIGDALPAPLASSSDR